MSSPGAFSSMTTFVSSSPPMGQGMRLFKQRSLPKTSQSVPTPVVRIGSAGQADTPFGSRRESSDGGQGRRLDFSMPRTPPVYAASVSAAANSHKPPVPAAKATFVGFDVPGSSAEQGVASEGSFTRQPSLLSRALSGSLSAELFGSSVMPSGLDFSQLVVVPSPREQSAPPAPLLEAQARHSVFSFPVVTAAYATAARVHAGQKRKNGESVLTHCLETALIVADLGLPAEHVAAALLHDVLSDTPLSERDLLERERVPREVVELVMKVTQLSDISQLYRDNTHSLEAEAILDMLTTMSDVGAVLIKLADRLHNMRTIEALTRCKQVRMATETLDVFSVLANRFGAWSMRSELEDLAFKTLNPDEYAAVAAAVAARAGSAADANAALGERMAELQTALEGMRIEVIDMSGRAKNLYGIWKKLQRRVGEIVSSPSTSPDTAAAAIGPAAVDLEGVWDVLALRVVVPHKHDCFTALRAVEQLWAPVPGRFKDYIHKRKGNGYQSLHTTVLPPDGGAPFEIQIRTAKMHYIAEYGFAAHWRYKERLDREDLWLDQLVQWKKWVAAEKLGIRDKKVRPGGGSIDMALASLGVGASVGPGDAAVLLDGSPARPVDRFLSHERLRLRPVSETEGLAVRVLVSGPGGVRIAQVPGGCTVGQLAAVGVLTDAEARAYDVRLNPAAGAAAASASAVLRSGDQVQLVAKPAALPSWREKLSGIGSSSSSSSGLGSSRVLVGAGERSGLGGMEGLDVYLPGLLRPVEVSMESKLRESTMELRSLALVS